MIILIVVRGISLPFTGNFPADYREYDKPGAGALHASQHCWLCLLCQSYVWGSVVRFANCRQYVVLTRLCCCNNYISTYSFKRDKTKNQTQFNCSKIYYTWHLTPESVQVLFGNQIVIIQMVSVMFSLENLYFLLCF